MFVYIIVNDVNLKIYVGKTITASLTKYFQSKISDALGRRQYGYSRLFSAIRKHGREHFSIHPLFECTTNEELCAHEQLLIKALAARNPEVGYNICQGGEGFTGPHSKKTRQKLSTISRHWYQDPAYRERRLAAWRQSVDERLASGSYHGSQEAVNKIKAARAAQDESKRIEGCKKWVAEHLEEASARLSHKAHVLGGKAGSREAKQRAARISVAGGSLVKAQHIRWHVNRGQTSPKCRLCRHSAD